MVSYTTNNKRKENKMKITTMKVLFAFSTGGVDGVVTLGMEALNDALSNIDPGNKKKAQSALNIAQKVLSVLVALKWLCPTKWQTAYSKLISSVSVICTSLEDMNVTSEEIQNVITTWKDAFSAWSSDDDETCVD